MELTPPVRRIRWKDTCRLVPARYPTTGILDVISHPEDLAAVVELEGWSNDRVSLEVGKLHNIPQREWVTGRWASVIMAAWCHPRPTGSRFGDRSCGAWYAGRSLITAHAEVAWHRSKELKEIGVEEARLQLRLYHADFSAAFDDIRGLERYHAPGSYQESQALGAQLLAEGSNGILYRSVRHRGGECIACFRPSLVANVRVGACFEYVWRKRGAPEIRQLDQA